MSEWDFDSEIARGASGRRPRLIQEWLCLHDIQVVIDGKYGPATEEAVRRFQTSEGLRPMGVVNKVTFDALVAPLIEARVDLAPDGQSVGALVVAYGRRHLAEHPREVGGQNLGPWVRLYMSGHEGPEWPWCAGFVSFLLQQASATAGVPMPVGATFSCDLLATDSQRRRRFLPGREVTGPGDIPPGSIFLNRRVGGDWVHTGIVTTAGADTFETIEGNTNDAGDREGYEVCRRVRGYSSKDFIIVV
jgi:peptidoglycan hydrolase-like protein with peptidoglycan-binding domain